MSAEVLASIPTDLEVIVSIAFRVRGAEFAEGHPFIDRFRTRTPDELDRCADAVRDAIWDGTLKTIRMIARPTP